MVQVLSDGICEGLGDTITEFLKEVDWHDISFALNFLAVATPWSSILFSALRVKAVMNQQAFHKEMARSVAELKKCISEIDCKINRVLQADMEAGLLALQSATAAEVESLSQSYLSNAVSFFMRAISQEQNTRKVQAVFNLGLCQFLQGDSINGWQNLFNSIRTPYVESPNETKEEFIHNRQDIQNSLATVIRDSVPLEERRSIPLLEGTVCSTQELIQRANSAADGEVIKLFPTQYDLDEPLVIRNNISFVPLFSEKAPIIASGLKEPIIFQNEGATFEKIVFIRKPDSENADAPFFDIQNKSPVFNSCSFLSKQNAIAIQGADSKPCFDHCMFVGAASNHVLISDNALGSFDNCEFESGGTAVTLENGANPSFNSCLIHNVDNGVNLLEGACGQFTSCDIFDYHTVGVIITGNNSTGFENCNIHANKHEHKIALPLYEKKSNVVASSIKTACKGFSSGFNKIKTSFWKSAPKNEPSVPAVVEPSLDDDPTDSTAIGLWLKNSSTGAFTNCSFYGNNVCIISVDDGSSVSLNKCFIHNGKQNGVYVTQKSQAELQNCTLESCSENNIFVDNNGIVNCVDCRISSAGKAGVYCNASGECSFSQCKIFKNGFSGLVLENSSMACVDKCVISQNSGFGINIMTGAGGKFTNNELIDNKSLIGSVAGNKITSFMNDMTDRSESLGGGDWNISPQAGSVLREGNYPNE